MTKSTITSAVFLERTASLLTTASVDVLATKWQGVAAAHAANFLSTCFLGGNVDLLSLPACKTLVKMYSLPMDLRFTKGQPSLNLNTFIGIIYKSLGKSLPNCIAVLEELLKHKLIQLTLGQNGEPALIGTLYMPLETVQAIASLAPKGPVFDPIKNVNNQFAGHKYTREGVYCGNHRSNLDHCPEHLERLGNIQLNVPKDFTSYKNTSEDLKAYYNTPIFLKFKEADHFFLGHRFDFRGRTYVNSWGVSYQGEATSKSAVELRNKEHLTARGSYWLDIDLANLLGQDKLTYGKRIKFIEDVRAAQQIPDGALDPSELPLYIQAARAYEASQAGEAIGYTVSLDATASGPQIIAAMFCDKASGKWVNITGSDKREDLYTAVYDAFMSSFQGSGINITRKEFKKEVVMPSLYGSKRSPENFFSTDVFKPLPYTVEQLCAHYWNVLGKIIPGVSQYTAQMVKTWDLRNGGKQSWRLPDGFQVEYYAEEEYWVDQEVNGLQITFKYLDDDLSGSKHISNAANLTHSIDGYFVREMTRRCMRDSKALVQAKVLLQAATPSVDAQDEPTGVISLELAYRIASGKVPASSVTEHDKAILISTIDKVRAMPYFEVLSVHDCFKVHPNYGDFLLQHYRDIMCDIARGRLFESLYHDLTGHSVTVRRGDVEEFCAGIQASEYLLC